MHAQLLLRAYLLLAAAATALPVSLMLTSVVPELQCVAGICCRQTAHLKLLLDGLMCGCDRCCVVLERCNDSYDHDLVHCVGHKPVLTARRSCLYTEMASLGMLLVVATSVNLSNNGANQTR